MIKDQPPPIPTVHRPIWEIVIEYMTSLKGCVPEGEFILHDQVIADMRERDELGRKRYGTPLTAHNGRNHLVDAYQEALDLAVYLAAWLDEQGYAPGRMPFLKIGSTAERHAAWRVFRIQTMFEQNAAMLVRLRSFIDGGSP